MCLHLHINEGKQFFLKLQELHYALRGRVHINSSHDLCEDKYDDIVPASK